MTHKTIVLLDNIDGRVLTEKLCQQANLRFDEFEGLVRSQVEHAGNARRRQLFAAFDDILDRIKLDEE